MGTISFPHADHVGFVSTDQIIADLGKTALSVLAGTVAGFVLTMVPPVGGALFTAASGFSFPYIEHGLLKIVPDSQKTAVKTAIKVAAILASMCLGGVALSLLGIPVSFLSMVVMTAAAHLTAYTLQNQSMGYNR